VTFASVNNSSIIFVSLSFISLLVSGKFRAKNEPCLKEILFTNEFWFTQRGGWVKNFINPYNIETARIAEAKICFRNRHSFMRSLFFKRVVYFRLQSEVISVCCISHWMYTFFLSARNRTMRFYYRILGFLEITIYYLKFQFRFVVSKRNFEIFYTCNILECFSSWRIFLSHAVLSWMTRDRGVILKFAIEISEINQSFWINRRWNKMQGQTSTEEVLQKDHRRWCYTRVT